MANTTNGNLLEVTGLKMHFPYHTGSLWTKKKGYIYAVDGVDLSIKKGETLGLVGESGCGKSTTLRAVSQLYRPTAGSVLLKGQELTTATPTEVLKARKDMQIVFQDPYASLNPRMTTSDIVAEPLRIFTKARILSLSKTEIDERVEQLLERVGLSRFFKNRYPHEFSGGQRQRIGIARALALKPDLMLCDEPVSALDVSIQSQILNLFKDLQEEFGLTYLFIAHDLAVIQYISNRIAVMYLGVIVELSNSAELYQKPLHPYTQALLSAAPIPDPAVERKRQRIILTGDVPSPDKVRTSCYFYDRCSKRMDKCSKSIPRLRDAGSGHQVACYLYNDPE
ncbi:MAG: peptide ABC transporter ATP-binding protein [Spirochaetae bacterium HGW-Spirochaetae-7]|jgi:oligopeptide transport system ATP-binding protein|nr:MAG: peptide ABC transporter ATP-binding protein [Spirochaetae bacterium HGW-Spirochaetae-7]